MKFMILCRTICLCFYEFKCVYSSCIRA